MKLNKCHLLLCLFLLLFLVSSCGTKKQKPPEDAAKNVDPAASRAVTPTEPPKPAQLPVRYQNPGFVTANDAADDLGEKADDVQIKVGATIRSTGGPQPLWDVMKRLANLKAMNVSWASDVNQNTLVDVDISADDNFFDAIDNLLRQADYFHEVAGKTIIVRYKETKTYQVGIPNMKGGYTTTVGGNFLQEKDAATGTEGTVKITSDQNQFDVWENIKLNLDTILEVWSIRREVETTGEDTVEGEAAEASRTFQGSVKQEGGGYGNAPASQPGKTDKKQTAKATEVTQRSSQAYYTIDKSIGLISVTAPKPLLEKVDLYITNLKKELFRQVALEAKIIEVYLQDNSKIGLDWSNVLKDFNITGTTFFGTAGTGGDGQVYPWIPAEGDADSVTRFVSKVTMNPVNFTVILNALNEQGDAHVLANPKITVLNGQPAIISVGKDIAYIKTVTKNIDKDDSGDTVTYTAEVDNVVEGIALGVMATIIDDKKVILHLTPITTNLVGGEVPYRTFGEEGLEVGLPEVRIREMSTMVEVNNGEMLVIGGLIDNVETNSGKFAPVVGSIPVVKYLFGVEEKVMTKRELVILLSPKIL